jgi:hypothetical protein
MKKNALLLFISVAMVWTSATAQTQIDKKTMLNLNKAKKTLTLKVGEKAYFDYTLHASVGLYGSYEISDSTLIKMIQEDVKYDNPNPPAGMTGADKAVATYIFEAKQTGKAKLIVKQLFRQEEESNLVFRIKVIK